MVAAIGSAQGRREEGPLQRESGCSPSSIPNWTDLVPNVGLDSSSSNQRNPHAGNIWPFSPNIIPIGMNEGRSGQAPFPSVLNSQER